MLIFNKGDLVRLKDNHGISGVVVSSEITAFGVYGHIEAVVVEGIDGYISSHRLEHYEGGERGRNENTN